MPRVYPEHFLTKFFLHSWAWERYNELGTTEADVMTEVRAAALRVKWTQRANPFPCQHRYLELEGIALGLWADNYYCIVCGECVVRNHHEFVFN